MVPLIELWHPILLSVVFVFIVTSILYMVIPIKGDLYTVSTPSHGVTRIGFALTRHPRRAALHFGRCEGRTLG